MFYSLHMGVFVVSFLGLPVFAAGENRKAGVFFEKDNFQPGASKNGLPRSD